MAGRRPHSADEARRLVQEFEEGYTRRLRPALRALRNDLSETASVLEAFHRAAAADMASCLGPVASRLKH
jgi:hypothetical protein